MSPAELAALYAAGALSPAETAEFERRVVAGEAAYVRGLADVEPIRDRLLDALAAEQITPPRDVRKALEGRLAAEESDDDNPFADEHDHEHDESHELVGVGVGGGGALPAGVTVLGASTARWRPTGLRGVRYRTLLADRRSNRRTIMLQMEPGSALPDHGHAGIEEVFMLTGDLDIAGRTLGPGDYIRIERGARHGVPISRSGCTCIVISDYVPFPLSSWVGFVKTAVLSLFSRPKR